MLGVARTQLLSHLHIGRPPEAREVVGDLFGPLVRCEQVKNDGNASAGNAGRLLHSEHFLDSHGENGVGIFSCSKSTNEMNYVAQKFARVAIGTNNIDSCNRT